MKAKLIAAGLALTAAAAIGAAHYLPGPVAHPWVQEYAAGEGNIKGNVDTGRFLKIDERLEIGADKDGVAVFKDPDAALKLRRWRQRSTLGAIRPTAGR